MALSEDDRQAARELAALAAVHVGWVSRDRLRRAVVWASRERFGRRPGWSTFPFPGTGWQDNPSDRGLRGRERAATPRPRRVFGVDSQVCRRCRAGWVEEPATEEGY